MMQVESDREETIVADLKSLRDKIIAGFERFEPEARFKRKEWDHHSGGGGEISVVRGDVFEKAAVNWSGVRGTKLPFNDVEEPFFCDRSQSDHSHEKPFHAYGSHECAIH